MKKEKVWKNMQKLNKKKSQMDQWGRISAPSYTHTQQVTCNIDRIIGVFFHKKK
jgi:hypothetical protein